MQLCIQILHDDRELVENRTGSLAGRQIGCISAPEDVGLPLVLQCVHVDLEHLGTVRKVGFGDERGDFVDGNCVQ